MKTKGFPVNRKWREELRRWAVEHGVSIGYSGPNKSRWRFESQSGARVDVMLSHLETRDFELREAACKLAVAARIQSPPSL